jgi:tripartite-type tricarboxylate transporter receptor subunit TctC
MIIRRTTSKWACSLGVVCLALSIAGFFAIQKALAQAESFPARPVQLIIPYSAGSTGDVAMRVVTQQLSTKFERSFIVDNRPGAAGIIAAKGAMAARPDGYTLMLNGNISAISTAMFKLLPYDALSDFEPISLVASFDMLVLTKADSPLKTFQDVLAYAKAHPGKLNIGTLSAGSTQYLTVELLKVAAQINIQPVPFRTSTDMATALLRGDLDVALEAYAPMQGLIESKKVNVIASTGKNRVYFMPDVPTVMESGVKDFDVSSWNGIAATKDTPRSIINKLSQAITEVLKSPESQAAGRRLGLVMAGSTPEEAKSKLKADIKKWSDLQAAANLQKIE